MRKQLLTAAFATLSGGAAAEFSAPMPVQAASVVPAGYSWTGFYIGINAGYAVSRNPSSLPGAGFTNANITSPSFDVSYTQMPAGAIGGGQIGFNWQNNNIVYGVEADFQVSGQKDSACLICVPVTDGFSIEQKMPWLATVRGRVGWARGPLLSYVTGGWAYGRVETDASFNITGVGSIKTSAHENRSGWTVGSGVEAALTGGWTAKVEYLYVNLGTTTTPFLSSVPFFGRTAHSSEIRNHVARLGLNHRFGATTGTGSSTSAAEPSSDWNGFYIGANAGRGIGRSPTNLSSTVLGDPFGNDTWQQGAEGYLGGLLAGMNWQASQWVFGIEADLQVSRMKDAACVFFCNDRLPSEVVEQKIPWFATVRGRLGYSTGPTLLYVTGGWAYGKMDTTISSTVTPIGARPGLPVVFGFSDMGSGWTIGGGADAALWGNWSARTEYLYVDLGSISNSFANNRVGPPAIDHVFRQDVRFHVFRGALTYRFASLLAAPY